MQGFLSNLMSISEKLTQYNRNYIVQLECKYRKRVKFEYEKCFKNEIFFIWACAYDNNFTFADLIVLYVEQHMKNYTQIS